MTIEGGNIEPFMVSEPDVEEVLKLTSYMDKKARAEVMRSLFPSELEMRVSTDMKVIDSGRNGVIYNARNK